MKKKYSLFVQNCIEEKKMEQNLNTAAMVGDVTALYAAITSDPLVLDKIDSITFVDTPLHKAAEVGQTHFALEIMILKPSLARKLNQNGYTPMHLAVMNGHKWLAGALLSRDKKLARVVGKEGRTPLHCIAATGGDSSLLRKMLYDCPDSVEDLTVTKETALHLAVKYSHIEVFEVLVESIKKSHKHEIYTWTDEEGYTILHQATMRSQIEMLKYLFQSYKHREWRLGASVQDLSGQTALDIAECFPVTDENREIMKKILDLGTFGTESSRPERYYSVMFRYICNQDFWATQRRTMDSRDAMLVVLGLVLTTSFQVGVSPPGGFWQDNGTSNGREYSAGTPILVTSNPVLYFFISIFTMAGFIGSLTLIHLLTMGMPMKSLLLNVLGFLSYTYIFAFIAITRTIPWVILTDCGLLLFQFVGCTLFAKKILPALVSKSIRRFNGNTIS